MTSNSCGQHAELIGAHARAMKAVDPTLQAFWNDNALSPEHLTAFLKATGDVMVRNFD